MLDKTLGDDLRHEFVGVVHAPAALKAQRIGQGIGEVGRVSESQLVSLHSGSIAAPSERNKNPAGYFPEADFVANGRDGGGEPSGTDSAFVPVCTIRVFLFCGARAAAISAVPASQPPGRGPLADQDDELNTLVAAGVFDD